MNESLHRNGYTWGKQSLALIAQVCPQGQAVLIRWMQLLDRTEGAPDVRLQPETVRSQAQADAYAAAGKGSKTSKHRPEAYADRKVRAWDFSLVGSRPYDRPLLDIAIGLMLQAADELRVPCRSGGDWDMDGVPTERDADERAAHNIADHVHGEIVEPHEFRYRECELARNRRAGLRAAGERYPR